MVQELRYTSIKRVLDNLLDHPMLQDLTLEQVVRHTIRFIGINGFSKMYQDKIDYVDIDEFRGFLPCDLVRIIQVKDCKSGICLRSMTDSFTPGLEVVPMHHNKQPDIHGEIKDLYIPPRHPEYGESAFKTQGRVIFTSFPHGRIEIAYKAIPVDDDGFPLLLDNENYLAALEAYIKKEVFKVKFETGKLSSAIYQSVQQEYAWLAGELDAELQIPSVSEMQSISNAINSLIPRMSEFYKGFKNLGDREYIKRH